MTNKRTSNRAKKEDPVKGRLKLRDEPAEPSDSIETACAKSEPVDERAPEPLNEERRVGPQAPSPAAYLPQGGVCLTREEDELDPGERVLEKESEHLRIPRRPG